ncbi:EAL domain-containing protein [Rhodoferax sp. BLA1]|uniref:EAL domain-containing protein n=1 Tax=Rhodoferax sp. BLA1 TaxID=2576062 RepID=UPI0015D22AD4|nr:EAL domain-containing protein [Rhodoferax sp. BLA1]
MRFLKQLRLHDKIRISFGALTALILVNALVVAAATYAIVGLVGQKQNVAEVVSEVDKVRLLASRYVNALSPPVARQVFDGLESTRLRINAAAQAQALNAEQLATMRSLLGDFMLHFEKYMVEADQKATVKKLSLSLSQRMSAHLDTAQLISLSARDRRALAELQSEVMRLQGLGQAIQLNLRLNRSGGSASARLHQTLAQLRESAQQLRTQSDFQQLVYNLQRDATDYVTSLDNFNRLQDFNNATEQQLADISDTLQQRSQQVSDSVDKTIRRQMSLAITLMGTIFLLTLLSALVSSRYLSQEILRPIRALVNVTQQIGLGQLRVRAKLGVADEIGELAQSFNDMTERLLGQNQALAVAHQELEKRVQARTLELAERGLMLRQIIDTAPIAIFLVNMQGRITQANAGMSEMFGIPMDSLLGSDYLNLVDPSELSLRRQTMDALMRGEIPMVDQDRRYQRANGEIFWAHLTGKLWLGTQGEKLGLIGVIADVTERKRAEEKLQLAASVFTYAREGIVITDARARVIDVNDTFTHITGFDRADVLGRNPRMLKSKYQTSAFYLDIWRTLTRTDQWSGEVWSRRKNGEVYAEMLTVSAVRNVDGQLQNYVALFSDITPIKAHQQQLENIAHFDPLTQLPNRLLLADRLHQAMLQCQRHENQMALAYLDLDGFKAINDSHGHDAGDELLVALAQSMKHSLREGDTLARIGGDEFVAVLADLNALDDHEPLLQRLLQAASSPVWVRGKTGPVALQVSASIGVTLYPQDNADADLLMRHADQAMYVAKQSGKNRFRLFDVAHDAAIKTQMESLARIRSALDQREFVLLYQPKANLLTGQITGAEALIRWRHPERGLLPPASFLPVFEDHPLSVDMGEWVIATALAQMHTWQTQGLHLPVSVNIGARQLQQDGFADRLALLLAAQPEVAPGQLQLEVLETSSLEDLAKAGVAMVACQKLGVSFALDDFGTGYSSLTYLRRLPADTLKIDQSFVRDMLDSPNDLAIVRGVIGLAHAFGREVIAEGVETAAHGELLASIGCTLAQGYGIARPMPAAELPDWMVRWHQHAQWTA